MTLFHATTGDGATQIDARGFADAAGYYRPDVDRVGVWVSDRPYAAQAGGGTPVLYAIDAAPEAVADYEWTQVGKPYREWLVPAQVLNALPRRRVTG